MAATSAFAQSTVEIYGIIDQGYASTKTTASDAPASLTLKTQATNLQGGLSTQRIGFRGTEDLGGGTKALFQIESLLSASEAPAAATGFGTRPTFVGLSDAKLGTLTAGRQDTPMLKAAGSQLAGGANGAIGGIIWSPFSQTTLTDAAVAPVAGLGRLITTTVNNAVNYKTPTFNGFDAEFQFSKDNAKASADNGTGTSASATSKNTQNGWNVKYANGPLTLNAATHTAKTSIDAAFAATNFTGGTYTLAADAEVKTKTNYMGATYDMSGVVLSLNHAKTKQNDGAAEIYNMKGTQLGVKAPIAGKVSGFASYGKGKRNYNDADATAKQTAYQLGALYSFSKRTTGYAVYGNQKLKGDSVGIENLQLKQTQYVIGLNHTF